MFGFPLWFLLGWVLPGFLGAITCFYRFYWHNGSWGEDGYRPPMKDMFNQKVRNIWDVLYYIGVGVSLLVCLAVIFFIGAVLGLVWVFFAVVDVSIMEDR